MRSLCFVVVFCVMACCISCKSSRVQSLPAGFPVFYKEGHRGTRGLMPENTIPAMKKGLETGANVIEVDVYTTKDNQVLIAHDPYINISHSLLAGGKEVSKAEAPQYVWHHMNYADIRTIDVGSKYYATYPRQQKIVTYMPLLDELIDSVEAYTAANHLPRAIYNIELKTSPKFDSLDYNATPAAMVKAVMDVVKSKSIANRFYLQSFDVRPLQIIHKEYPTVTIAFLTAMADVEKNLAALGFVPPIYSPEYRLVTPAVVQQCHQQKMKLVPWTVNDKAEIKKLIGWGVDGIITDYPDYLSEVMNGRH